MKKEITALYWPTAADPNNPSESFKKTDPKNLFVCLLFKIFFYYFPLRIEKIRYRSLYSLFRRWHSIIRPISVLVHQSREKKQGRTKSLFSRSSPAAFREIKFNNKNWKNNARTRSFEKKEKKKLSYKPRRNRRGGPRSFIDKRKPRKVTINKIGLSPGSLSGATAPSSPTASASTSSSSSSSSSTVFVDLLLSYPQRYMNRQIYDRAKDDG